MSHLLDGFKKTVEETFLEEDLIAHSRHKKLEHLFLTLRNLAVAVAMVLFLLSLIPAVHGSTLKAIAYFFGAAAYFCEILLLTDCLTTKVPPKEMFMAFCFGPMYILLGLSYLFGH